MIQTDVTNKEQIQCFDFHTLLISKFIKMFDEKTLSIGQHYNFYFLCLIIHKGLICYKNNIHL